MADILTKMYASSALQAQRAMAREPYEVIHSTALSRRAERRCLLDTLRSSDGIAIVAEIKRASPSAGLIAHNFDPVSIARTYDAAKADAISVLTEPDHFLGDLAYLDQVRAVTSRPILRKDFLATPYQVAQSAAYGADAILLIVAGLDVETLAACMREASSYDLDVLVEVHDDAELDRAILCGARLVGVNNRNLRTMQTDLAVSDYLLPKVPQSIFAISESGMRDARDVERLYRAGARGCLVGEALMRAGDPGVLLAALKHSCAPA